MCCPDSNCPDRSKSSSPVVEIPFVTVASESNAIEDALIVAVPSILVTEDASNTVVEPPVISKLPTTSVTLGKAILSATGAIIVKLDV